MDGADALGLVDGAEFGAEGGAAVGEGGDANTGGAEGAVVDAENEG